MNGERGVMDADGGSTPGRGIDRRTVLRGSLVAGVIGAIGFPSAASATPSGGATAASTTVRAAGLPAGASRALQIGAFWPPPAALLNATQYDWLRDAYVTVLQNVVGNDLNSAALNHQMLTLAGARGMKVVVADTNSAGLKTNPAFAATIASEYGGDPALFGFYVKDEPLHTEFAAYAAAYRRFLMEAPQYEPLLNLLPMTVYNADYENYLEGWIGAVGASYVKRLAYDRYPWPTTGGIHSDWFENVEIVRHSALRHNLPTGAYLQSVGIPGGLRRPTEIEMRYNAHAYLAYGFGALYWFTWATPENRSEPFTNAIIAPNGTKTDLYAPVQAIGRSLTNLGAVTAAATSQAVYHSGVMATGTVPVPGNSYWRPVNSAANVIVSHFVGDGGRRYVLIVDRTLDAGSKTLQFATEKNLAAVNEVSSTTGLETPAAYNAGTGVVTASFLAGEARLFALPAGFSRDWNLAAGRPVSASTSVEAWSFSKAGVVDGNTATCWSSEGNVLTDHEEWVSVDLGGVHVVNAIRLTPRMDTPGEGFPLDFVVEVSKNGTSWTGVVNRVAVPQPTAAVEYGFGRQPARYVRVRGTKLRPLAIEANHYRLQLSEIEVYHRVVLSPGAGLFSDDFSGDLRKWVNARNCSVSGGTLTVTAAEDIRNANGGLDWTDYAVEATLRVDRARIGLVFRCSDAANFYMWQLGADGALRPHVKIAGAWTLLKTVTGVVPSGDFTVRVDAVGSTFTTRINGTVVDVTTHTAHVRGNIGFRADTAVEGASIDTVSVVEL
ncbi:discoidin domain-containing protein [Microbacterium oxydans]|uniref:discoidin domain-containing protein n=1 Tax=Microbacterium sp. B19(2022) TaxID=2914045 RepID=UPI001430BE0F|nr:discoidin domain-containing protein [Microbacterium sp. B19(2022)]